MAFNRSHLGGGIGGGHKAFISRAGAARSAFDIDIDIDPSPLILAKEFRDLGADIRSFKEPLKRAIQKVLAPSFQKNFDVGGRPTWTPLADYTVKKKGHSKPLVRSGTLRRVAGQLNIWEIQGERGMAYVKGMPGYAWYGKLHQEGTAAGVSTGLGAIAGDPASTFIEEGSGLMPPRPFLVIQPQDAPKIREEFEKYVEERIQRRMAMRSARVWHAGGGS